MDRIKIHGEGTNFRLAEWAGGDQHLHLNPPDFLNDFMACEKWLIPAVFSLGYDVRANFSEYGVLVVIYHPKQSSPSFSGEGEKFTTALCQAVDRLALCEKRS